MRRKMLQLVLGFLAMAMPFAVAMPQAHADDVGTLLGLVNNLRSAHGAAPLAMDPLLTSLAQQWSAHMAAAGGLSHNPALTSAVPTGWTRIGENVGTGGGLSVVFNALVNSPPHFANMIDPGFNLTGIAVLTAGNGTVWITEDFEGRPGAAPAPAPAPAPTPSPAPVVVPAPTPRPAPIAPKTAAPVVVPPKPAAPVPPAATPSGSKPPAATPPNPAPTTATSTGTPTTIAGSPALSSPALSPERSGHQLKAVGAAAIAAPAQHRSQTGGWLVVAAGISGICLLAVALATVGRLRFGWM